MEENFNIHLGKKLRMRRLSLGLTQTKVAQAINVTFQQIQKYEKGTNGVSSNRLMQLSQFLKVPIIYFFEDFKEFKDISSGDETNDDLNYSFFSIRSIEGKKHYFQKIKFFHNLLHNFLSVYDKEIALIEDSKSGNPEGSVIKNKFYTSSYFFYLLFATIIKKNIEIKNIKFVIELGSGVGFMGYLLKKLNTNIKYICCDLPPAIFVAEKYLKNSGFKVAGYDYFKNIYSIDEVEFDKYDCFCLPNWKAEILKDFKNDLFINIGSFQEMEKKQVNNYMNIFFKNTKYILLHQTIFSKEVALKKKDHGVLDSVDKKFYYENLKKYSFFERDYLDMGDKFSAFFVSERNKS